MAWSRRAALTAMAAGVLARPAEARDREGDAVGQSLLPWRRGHLDIHHIATGRGDSTLVIGPDGSSLMIDAGASRGPVPPGLAPRPNDSLRPGQWIGRYALRRLKETGGSGIDVFLATHQHPDHIGDPDPDAPLAPGGTYRLTGVMDVDAMAPIARLLDRGFPHYDQPTRVTAPFQANYEAFVAARLAAGRSVERFRPGALNQLRRDLRGTSYPEFSVRNLAVNGEVWTGEGEDARTLFPPLDDLAQGDIPEENVWSAAVRLSYGPFGYFAAGDLTSNTFDGALPWRDVEAAAARASGPVDVAVTPHHGMFDATSAATARALAPRTWIIPAWHALHPSPNVLDRLLSSRLYPGERLVLATGLDPAFAAAAPWLARRLASQSGHVIVRVDAGGRRYSVVVTDNGDESDRVAAVFGPFKVTPRGS
jgi:beta-lactamase superfamily II metal-dependent hydrolase